MKLDLRTFFTGMAMGAADVVPGVSGGTIAFISGIYDRLLDSIRSINPRAISVWRKQGFAALLKHIDAGFLVTLLSGILLSILTLARGISYLLEHHPIPLWSFFFGLIVYSIGHIGREALQAQAHRPAHSKTFSKLTVLWPVVSAVAGFSVAWVITVANPLSVDVTPLVVLGGGMLAICAMILPGISGSFILLLLGLYSAVLGAVKSLDLLFLATFALGCVLGLLSFSHVLSFLLRRYRQSTLTFLCGLMLGTLNKVWPWKEVLSWRTNSSGEQVPMHEQVISPWQFEALTGDSHQLPLAIACLLGGVLIVWGLERLGSKHAAA